MESSQEENGKSNHLTNDVTSSIINFHRWNLSEFNLYMKIAIFFSLLPLPMSAHAIFIGIKRGLWLHYLFDSVGLLFVLYRIYLLTNIAIYSKKITIEYIERIIKIMKFNFVFYLVESIVIIINYDDKKNSDLVDDDEFIGGSQDIYAPKFLRPYFLSTYIWTAIIYFIVNVLLTFPDLFILQKLLYFLNYNFDGHDFDDNFDDDFAFQLDLDIPSVNERKTEKELRRTDIELAKNLPSNSFNNMPNRPISSGKIVDNTSMRPLSTEINENFNPLSISE